MCVYVCMRVAGKVFGRDENRVRQMLWVRWFDVWNGELRSGYMHARNELLRIRRVQRMRTQLRKIFWNTCYDITTSKLHPYFFRCSCTTLFPLIVAQKFSFWHLCLINRMWQMVLLLIAFCSWLWNHDKNCFCYLLWRERCRSVNIIFLK